MRAPEYQGSFLGRISIRRNQVISMETNHEQELEVLEQFQKHVSDRFSDLMASPPSDASSAAGDQHHHHGSTAGESLLSIAWLRKLLDAFVCCEAEFKAILVMGRDPSHISKPPLDRLIPEMLDREVKSLDVCNAVTHGVESVRNLQKLAEIAVAALDSSPVGEGQFRRAKKALAALAAAVALDEKESSAGGKSTERSWSLGRRGGGGGIQGSGGLAAASLSREGSLRSSSWTVSKNWSAAKQIHAMAANLVAPRGGENSSLALTAYMMSTVLVFVMWALVAAIPCQERAGLPTSIPVPRNLGWAQPMVSLQEKIAEEWKRKEKKSAAGLMEEMQQMEKLCQALIDHADSFQPPMSASAAAASASAGTEDEEKRAVEMAAQVAELAEVCRKMEDGLAPLQMQIREVFRRMVRSRTEVLEVLDQAAKSSASSVI